MVGLEVSDRRLLLDHPEAAEGAPLVLADPPRAARLALYRVGERTARIASLPERQRLDEALAEPGVREPALAVEVDEQRHVVRRPLAADDGLMVGDDEAGTAQQGGEQGVELEAVAAATVVQDALGQRRLVERAGLPQLDREVLVGQVGQVGAVQRAQTFEIRRGGPIEPDPGQQRSITAADAIRGPRSNIKPT